MRPRLAIIILIMIAAMKMEPAQGVQPAQMREVDTHTVAMELSADIRDVGADCKVSRQFG